MAIPTAPSITVDVIDTTSEYGSDIHLSSASTEYGSDFDPEEETLIGELLGRIATKSPKSLKPLAYPHIDENEASAHTVVVHRSPPCTLVPGGQDVAVQTPEVVYPLARVKHDVTPQEIFNVIKEEPSTTHHDAPTEAETAPEAAKSNGVNKRSPLERFREKPKKPLSVTDLVSLAWCELQWWFNLTSYGRKPRTADMKEGSRIHRKLEEEVHRIVPIRTKSKEDRFGLRIWNVIQGLRTLRATGMTRELQVWGIIEGEVVNGIIDEISYTCPDPALEESLQASKAAEAGSTALPVQLTISQLFANADGNDVNAWVDNLEPDRMVYISDVKTRKHNSGPAEASVRQTWMQLMLYRKLLEALAQNTVDAETIFARYDLEPLASFTEVFMLELCGLDAAAVAADENTYNILQASETYQHRNLLALWSLMITEFGQSIVTFSDILRAEYRYAKTGSVIENKLQTYDQKAVDAFVSSVMEWWRGEREAKGVEIEDAFKCRNCEFADVCGWRKRKMDEAMEKHRLRWASRRMSCV